MITVENVALHIELFAGALEHELRAPNGLFQLGETVNVALRDAIDLT